MSGSPPVHASASASGIDIGSPSRDRKTSSPLSSPSSARGLLAETDEPEEEGITVDVEGGSPATSSTLPLTDDEDEDEGEDQEEEEEGDIRMPRFGSEDDESELTEEDEDEEEEEQEEIEDGDLPKQSASIPSHSTASTGSLTPPPSDPLPTSPLPKVTNTNSIPTPRSHSVINANEEEDEEDESDDEEGDGDVTMRAEMPTLDENPQDGGTEVVDVDEEPVENGIEVQMAVEAEEKAEDVDKDEEANVDADAEGEAEEDIEDEPETTDSPAYLTVPTMGKTGHSTHAPPPTSASMRALLMLEVKFAALRDKLYIERMEEAAAEEEMILNGTHPTLKYLYKTLSSRREKLHEVASRRHQQTLTELKRVREAEQNLVWSSWTTDRDSLHWDEFEQTWSKRRRLAREKNEIEMPRITKPVPRVGQPSSVRPFDWSAGATPIQLGRNEAVNDLALMGTVPLQLSRHASPAVYGQHQHQQQNQHQQSQSLVSQYNVSGPSAVPVNIPTPPAAQTATGGGSNIYSNYPETNTGITTTQHHVFAPTRTNQPQPQTQPQSQSPGSGSKWSSQFQQQRREGRTVPTTSDLFDGPKRTNTSSPIIIPKDVKSPPIIGGGGGGGIISHGLWGRQIGIGVGSSVIEKLNGNSSPLGGGSVTGSTTIKEDISTPPISSATASAPPGSTLGQGQAIALDGQSENVGPAPLATSDPEREDKKPFASASATLNGSALADAVGQDNSFTAGTTTTINGHSNTNGNGNGGLYPTSTGMDMGMRQKTISHSNGLGISSPFNPSPAAAATAATSNINANGNDIHSPSIPTPPTSATQVSAAAAAIVPTPTVVATEI